MKTPSLSNIKVFYRIKVLQNLNMKLRHPDFCSAENFTAISPPAMWRKKRSLRRKPTNKEMEFYQREYRRGHQAQDLEGRRRGHWTFRSCPMRAWGLRRTVSPDDCQPAGHTEGRDRHSPWGPPRACRTTQVPAGKCDQNPQTKSTLLLKLLVKRV